MHTPPHFPRIPRSQSSKSRNVATFAGAVGGSAGILSILALWIAFSIYRRRLVARRRDRAYRETAHPHSRDANSLHTDGSEDGPPMHGPQPFIPRYFPGTVINSTPPPPYTPPPNDVEAALLAPVSPSPSVAWSSRRLGGVISDSDISYADRPPPTPPPAPPGIYDHLIPTPIATPTPAILTSAPPPPPPPQPIVDESSLDQTGSSPVVPLIPPPPSSHAAIVPRISGESAGRGGPPGLAPSVTPMSSRASVRSNKSIQSVESVFVRQSSSDSGTVSVSRLAESE